MTFTGDEVVLAAAHLAQAPGNAAVDWLVTIDEDTESVRGPGWCEAECQCGWRTSGLETVVEDVVSGHVHDAHAAFVAFLTRTIAGAIRTGRPLIATDCDTPPPLSGSGPD